MRDPWEILGVSRGASFEEVRAAYRRACKTRHPDMGGSHEAMVELNTAYAFILDELKRGRGANAGAEKPREETSSRAGEQANAHDIDEEVEALRRASESLDERLRGMRQQAWRAGEHVVWARLTWEDIARFFGNLARGGVKGLATIFAALIGVGTILVEANFISALLIFGSSIGFFVSLAMKSDKGGFMSASVLMFGVATLWVPAVRAALFGWPVATISVLVCLALIFKFAREGGIAGLMTGGVLGLFLIGVILDDTRRGPQLAVIPQKQSRAVAPPASRQPSPAPGSGLSPVPATPLPLPNAPRDLLAASGSVLKFAAGVPYQLKIRSGMRTRIVANFGSVAFYRGDTKDGDCVSVLEFASPASKSPYSNVERLIRACDDDAVFEVTATQ